MHIHHLSKSVYAKGINKIIRFFFMSYTRPFILFRVMKEEEEKKRVKRSNERNRRWVKGRIHAFPLWNLWNCFVRKLTFACCANIGWRTSFQSRCAIVTPINMQNAWQRYNRAKAFQNINIIFCGAFDHLDSAEIIIKKTMRMKERKKEREMVAKFSCQHLLWPLIR